MKRWLSKALLSVSIRTAALPRSAMASTSSSSRPTTTFRIVGLSVKHQQLHALTFTMDQPSAFASDHVSMIQRRWLSMRGGDLPAKSPPESPQYVILSEPAPGSPFHYAFPVHDLDVAKDFYGRILGCQEGRSSSKWQDYSLYGHQIVAHWVGNDYRCQDYYNPVDGDEVPVPHAGLALTVAQFHELAERVRTMGVQFIIEPHLRFQGMPGEQYTMFFKDPSGNNLEFKAMTHPENLFAKYNVVDK